MTNSHAMFENLMKCKLNYSGFKMKLDLSGYVPDNRFFTNFMRMYIFGAEQISSDTEKSNSRLFIECLKHGMFLDFFKDWANFFFLLKYTGPDTRVISDAGKRAIEIFDIVCKQRPGILIGHFLKHGVHGRWNDASSFDFFENAAKCYSERIAARDKKYRTNVHPKVMEAIERNRNLEMALN